MACLQQDTLSISPLSDKHSLPIAYKCLTLSYRTPFHTYDRHPHPYQPSPFAPATTHPAHPSHKCLRPTARPSTPSHTLSHPLTHLGLEGCSHGRRCMRRAERPADIQRLLILSVQQRAEHPNRTSTRTSTRTVTRTISTACRYHCLMLSMQQRVRLRNRTSITARAACGYSCLGCGQTGACLIAGHS